ncbi:MAG: class E sortase [Microthrixaceae bacterium]
MSRAVGVLGRILVIAGLFILGFVAFQLWGTGVQESRAQDGLAEDLAPAGASGDGLDAVTNALARTDPATAPPTPQPAEGDPVGVIEIPKIGLQRVVVQGVSKADLKKGPGHYPETPLPGQPGNSGIAGHRTTYGAPFNRIDELNVGDEIVLTTPQGRFTYRVVEGPVAGQAWYSVDPEDVSVLRDFGDDRITLTACHPKYSAQERIIVHAVLQGNPAAAAPVAATTPAGGGRDTTATVDQGLGGDPNALVPTLLWGGAALLVGLGAWWLGRKWRRWPSYLIATPVVLVLVWCCYVQLDKYLPAL